MKRAIFVVSQKGGSGKSTFSRALLDVFRFEHQLSVAAFDADGNVGQLLQYYGQRDEHGKLLAEQDPFQGVFPFDVRDAVQRDNVINALDYDADMLLFDFPGGAVDALQNVLQSERGMTALAEEYQRAGYAVTVAIVISNILASANNVIRIIKQFGPTFDYLAVKNLFFGENEDFILFDGFQDAEGNPVGGMGRNKLLEHGGQVLSLPKLRGREYALLDLYSLGFTEAMHSPKLRRAEKSNIFYFLDGFKTTLHDASAFFETQNTPEAAHAATR